MRDRYCNYIDARTSHYQKLTTGNFHHHLRMTTNQGFKGGLVLVRDEHFQQLAIRQPGPVLDENDTTKLLKDSV